MVRRPAVWRGGPTGGPPRSRGELARRGSAATTPESPSGNAVEVRASAAEAMGTVAEALRAAAKAVRRDAKALKAARKLRFEAASALQEIAGLRYGTARAGLTCLIMWLDEEFGRKRDHLATSFNRLGRVLAEFCTISWNWRVFFCGFAALVAAVHGFVARVNDPIMNVALSGVSEDVWTLVYVGLGAMIFLASALQWGEYSIGEREEELLCWNEKARRIGTENPNGVCLHANLKSRSHRAVYCYFLLLLVVVVIAVSGDWPWFGPAFNALRNPATPPSNPHLGSLTLDHVILLVLVVAFVCPALWILRHLKHMAKVGS